MDTTLKNDIIYHTSSLENGKTCTVRQARTSDAADILSVKKEMLQPGIYDALLPEEYHSDVEQEAEWIDFNKEGDHKFIAVCEIGGRVDGVLYFQCSTELRCTHWGEFGMGVREDCRGQGLGTKLLDALFKWAEETPHIEKVCLKVFDANQGAHRLYQRLGFVEEGRLKKCLRLKDGTYTDAILMAKFMNKDNKQSST